MFKTMPKAVAWVTVGTVTAGTRPVFPGMLSPRPGTGQELSKYPLNEWMDEHAQRERCRGFIHYFNNPFLNLPTDKSVSNVSHGGNCCEEM